MFPPTRAVFTLSLHIFLKNRCVLQGLFIVLSFSQPRGTSLCCLSEETASSSWLRLSGWANPDHFLVWRRVNDSWEVSDLEGGGLVLSWWAGSGWAQTLRPLRSGSSVSAVVSWLVGQMLNNFSTSFFGLQGCKTSSPQQDSSLHRGPGGPVV